MDLLQFIVLYASTSMAEAASIGRSISLSHGFRRPIDGGYNISVLFVEMACRFISDVSASIVEMVLACNW